MNLYLLTQSVNDEYDTYDSMVVVAEKEEDAILIRPTDDHMEPLKLENHTHNPSHFDDWANPKDVKVTLIGTTDIDYACIVCSSFNAG